MNNILLQSQRYGYGGFVIKYSLRPTRFFDIPQVIGETRQDVNRDSVYYRFYFPGQ